MFSYVFGPSYGRCQRTASTTCFKVVYTLVFNCHILPLVVQFRSHMSTNLPKLCPHSSSACFAGCRLRRRGTRPAGAEAAGWPLVGMPIGLKRERRRRGCEFRCESISGSLHKQGLMNQTTCHIELAPNREIEVVLNGLVCWGGGVHTKPACWFWGVVEMM